MHIPAHVQAHNIVSGLWTFTTSGDVWYGKHVEREEPPVGTDGSILDTGNPNGNFDFVWHVQPGNVYHQSVFSRASRADNQHCPEYLQLSEKYEAASRRLGITPEIEKIVMDYLSEIGVLDYCANQGSCTGACPEGQGCITSTTGNCLCSTKFQTERGVIVKKK
jgi:hypothetical protein